MGEIGCVHADAPRSRREVSKLRSACELVRIFCPAACGGDCAQAMRSLDQAMRGAVAPVEI
jgi:hypothetical protein